MTFQFTGSLKYRFRLTLFGYEIFAGPWVTQAINVVEPLPAESASIPLPDGFSATAQTEANGVALGISWEGLPVLTETVPLTGSLPISLQPLKGVILAGSASIVG